MPRVPEYTEQFRYGSVDKSSPRLNNAPKIETSADMFGAGQAKGLDDLGKGLTKLGNASAWVYNDHNNTVAVEAANKAQADFMNWQTEAAKRVGKDGMNTGADYETWTKKQLQESTKGMNDVQRGRFLGMMETKIAAQKQWAQSYGYAQTKTYEISTYEAKRSVNIEDLNKNIENPELAMVAIEGIRDSSFNLAQMKGLAPEAGMEEMRKSVSDALTSSIHNQILNGNTSMASVLMHQFKNELGTSSTSQLNGVLRREKKRQETEARANQERITNERVVNVANELHKINGNDTAAVWAETEKISDPIIRNKVLANYFSISGMAEKAADQAQKNLLKQDKEKAMEALRANGLTPQEHSKIINNARVENQEELTKFSKKIFEGDSFISDPAKLHEARGKVINGDIKDLDTLKKEYSAELSDSDIRKLEEVMLEQKSSAIKAGEKNRFMYKAKNVYGKDSVEAEAAYLTYSKLAVDNGVYTPEGRKKLMDDIWQGVPMKKDGLVRDDKESVPKFEVGAYKANGWYEAANPLSKIKGVPGHLVSTIETALRGKRKIVSPENIKNFYELNKEVLNNESGK